MNDFTYILALALWAINIIALLWVNRKMKNLLDKTGEKDESLALVDEGVKKILAVTKNIGASIFDISDDLAEDHNDLLTEIKKTHISVNKGNKDQQEIKSRLSWAKKRQLKDLIAEKVTKKSAKIKRARK